MVQKDYIIDHTIRFSPASETLGLIDNPDSFVVLTPACNRLLMYLISNQGAVLSRERIFSTLWEQYGKTPSNSSLNSYISLIRKSFVNLGLSNEIISTIPKIGFLFNSDIQVEVELIESKDVDARNEDTSREDSPDINTGFSEHNNALKDSHDLESTTHVNNKNKSNDIDFKYAMLKFGYRVFWFVFCVTLIVLPVLIFTNIMPNKIPPINPVKVGKFGNCDIVFLPTHAGNTFMFSAAEAHDMVTISGFTCKPGGVYYLYTNKRVSLSEEGRIYVSYCDLKNQRIMDCTNFISENIKLEN
ncbi:winged helix-turn-helix domain-containing protein [Kosakonia oryziphila]|uniref:DNA-binding winged helix-turn-helix (WHTH) domain-containing protein n=1 Tax=Kosakonia oryziphila TaxID=1005667 RepID=A0A1C4GFJ0_9ENTR|nr:winged helix-turn-helix domain-containing protein [Kosakonia oryziphila]SCC66970.1 DNA-binding winged helix-turn-helix (wHTH) domain-containing protein [Kosakonia oryziphila]